MIEVEIIGDQQVPKHRSNISGYSYSEEATPVSPGDSAGGVGAISFETRDEEDVSALIYKDEIYLTDSHNGSISGRVNSISASDGVVSFSGTSNLARLNITKVIPPVNGTLGELILLVFNEAGIFSGINIDPTIDSIAVISPGYDGDLWVFLKDICTVYEIEIALVEDTLYVRHLRLNNIYPFDIVSEGWSIGDINPAQFVDVNYYNYSYESSFLAYPKGGWTDETQVYQVDANQVLTVELPVSAYLESIVQPTLQSTVGRYEDSASVYCVAAKDGLPFPTAQWTDNGGDLTAELINDGQTILVTITGANAPDFAPFRIGVSAGPSDYYSSLRIMGTGVAYDLKTIKQPTGLTVADTSNEVGITIDNKFISTEEQARDAAKRAILAYSIPAQKYSFTAPNLGDFLSTPGTIIYQNFGEYDNSLPSGYEFQEVDSDIGLWDFDTFDENLDTTVVVGVSGQLFGNVAGARVRFRDTMYRIKSATITPTKVSAEAEWDTLVSDFNTANTGETFATFNSTFDNLSFTDFTIIPMRSA
jgi:hypothetical protein